MAGHRSSANLPDAVRHNPDPAYVRSLIERAGLSQRAAARLLGIAERTMRYHCKGDIAIPYSAQYCLEVLASGTGPRGANAGGTRSSIPA